MIDSTLNPSNGPAALPTTGGQPPSAEAAPRPVSTSQEAPPDQASEQQEEVVEDGGSVISAIPVATYNPQRDHQTAAKNLALIFAGILAAGIALHYVATIGLYVFGYGDGAKELTGIFNTWLPVVSSIVTAISTYYFTRPKDQP
jgi:hypothetical protein